MPTTGVVNSTLLTIRTGSTASVTAIQHVQDVSLTVNHSPRDITTKDSAGWAEYLEGLRSYEVTFSGLLAHDDTQGGDEFETYVRNRTLVYWQFGTFVASDPKFSGSGYITSVEQSSPTQEDNATWSVTIQGVGAYSVGTFS